jgi:polysaccharide biosynthesis transport protein
MRASWPAWSMPRCSACAGRSTSRHTALHALELLEEAHANVVGATLTQVDVNIHTRSGYADAEVYHPRHGGYFRE